MQRHRLSRLSRAQMLLLPWPSMAGNTCHGRTPTIANTFTAARRARTSR